jgi:hypothetical protein
MSRTTTSPATAVRAHHRTTAYQIPSTAPPWNPLPPPPLSWTNRAEVRAHCRLFPARSSPERRCPHGPPWPALHRALPSHLVLVSPFPSRLDAHVTMLPGKVVPSCRNMAAHRRDMAAAGARTWPHSSTSPQPLLVASLGPPWLQGANAHLSWPSSGQSSPAHHRAPPPSRRHHGCRS